MATTQKIKTIIDRWFITEPLLFSAYCTHELVENPEMGIPFRTGKRKIEYSPRIIEKLELDKVEEWLKLEIYRILLGHPYQRIPKGAEKKKNILLMASDVTINHFYKAKVDTSGVRFFKDYAILFGMTHPLGYRYDKRSDEYQFFERNLRINDDEKSPHFGDLETVDDLPFEQWYKWVNFLVSWRANGSGEDQNTGSEREEVDKSDKKPSDKYDFSTGADLWQEDDEVLFQVHETINKAANQKEWGKINADLKSEIIANTCVPVDYRKILNRFKSSILASNRSLTRMRPNRRFGYRQMGCRYEKKSKILIAVDVSGSVSDENLNQFFSIIKEFFKYGIDKLDVLQFDSRTSKPIQLKRNFEKMKIVGRGGTDFNPPMKFYLEHSEYDGMIIFTDGCGNKPVYETKRKMNVVWILINKKDYEAANLWISNLKGNLATYIPMED
ncbi:MAG: VWA-like domain-containing protein [Treponema sp.]|nr:VWA-like domain-containing protein [Treponema sp.]